MTARYRRSSAHPGGRSEWWAAVVASRRRTPCRREAGRQAQHAAEPRARARHRRRRTAWRVWEGGDVGGVGGTGATMMIVGDLLFHRDIAAMPMAATTTGVRGRSREASRATPTGMDHSDAARSRRCRSGMASRSGPASQLCSDRPEYVYVKCCGSCRRTWLIDTKSPPTSSR